MGKAIYLTRHGQTLSNKHKIYAGWNLEELSQEGVLQVEKAGERIRDLDISSIYTSPIPRAVQTAQVLNQYIQGELIVEPDLKEIKMGSWEGLAEDEVARRYPSEYKIWLERPAELRLQGRETLQEVQQRARRAINGIVNGDPHDDPLLVTHVAIIRCLYLYFKRLPLNLYKTIEIPNICLHKITFCKGNVKMEKIM